MTQPPIIPFQSFYRGLIMECRARVLIYEGWIWAPAANSP